MYLLIGFIVTFVIVGVVLFLYSRSKKYLSKTKKQQIDLLFYLIKEYHIPLLEDCYKQLHLIMKSTSLTDKAPDQLNLLRDIYLKRKRTLIDEITTLEEIAGLDNASIRYYQHLLSETDIDWYLASEEFNVLLSDTHDSRRVTQRILDAKQKRMEIPITYKILLTSLKWYELETPYTRRLLNTFISVYVETEDPVAAGELLCVVDYSKLSCNAVCFILDVLRHQAQHIPFWNDLIYTAEYGLEKQGVLPEILNTILSLEITNSNIPIPDVTLFWGQTGTKNA